jgi:long-chain acyl-CoA synthetase
MRPQGAQLPFSFQSMGVTAVLKAAAARAPGKVAYTQGGRERSYAALVERSDRVSAALVAGHGLQSGQHIAIVAKNSIEYMEIVFGAAQAGVPVATINPRLSVPELVAICDDARAQLLFVDTEQAGPLRDARFASVRSVVTIGPDYEALLAQARPAAGLPAAPEWGVFTIPYTSGTTGKPKGVLVSHRSRVLSVFGMAAEYGCFGPDDRFLAIAPMCHGAGLIFSLAPVLFGGHCEVMDKFDPGEVMRRLRAGGTTGFFGVPTHFHALMSLEPALLEAERPRSLRTVISNAAALPQTMKEKLVGYFGEGLLHETYGSTEAGIVTNLRPADQLRKQQCVGQPFPATRIELRRDDGSLCGTDEVGELFSSSPYLFNGYWQKPEATAEAWHDGWVTVGDLARRDADGHYYIVDRKKDMVITGGVNVYPREIEEVLVRHPDILEVAVIGLPDERWGERLLTVAVPREGRSLSAADITGFCEGKIASFKIPKELAMIDELPRNANGKVLKTELRKHFMSQTA